MTILVLITLTSSGAAGAQLGATVPDTSSPLGSLPPGRAHAPDALAGPHLSGGGLEPCVPRLRRAVVARRAATWRWEVALGRTPTPTARRARTATSCAYLRWIKNHWAVLADKGWHSYAALSEPVQAIRHVFGRYADQAIAVAWCESRHDRYASNGQYLGLFQMGSSERVTYGHGTTALEQARAAYRYFSRSGYDWSPWACKPH